MDRSIHFFKEGVKFRLNDQAKLLKWLKATAKKESYKILCLNYIFCNDDYLLEMNKNYLNHNYFTDIITFDNSIQKNIIEGDVFISIDTINKNAKRFETGFDNELHRVMIHGLLHLLGYKDKTEKDKKKMRAMEDKYLSQF
ncbi:MAG TPA: rRNA maturation RNase YbeY [Bacteroidia bacterium]|nr:rRNA maturation RNase YbeY [Bacteroidia bacterium]HNS12856.1 rRNA maturation RNase YbeY [Bacteroidia bacterium]